MSDDAKKEPDDDAEKVASAVPNETDATPTASVNGQDAEKGPAESGDDSLPIEPEVFQSLPPEIQNVVRETIFGFAGPARHPVLSKMNEGHVTSIIENSGKEDERRHEDRRQSRRYTALYVVLAVALFVFLTVYLVGSNDDVYADIIKIAVAFGGGMGSGYGLKAYRDRS